MQSLTFSETATSTAAVGTTTYCVRLLATASCYVDMAQTPTATSATMLLAANVPEYFLIQASHKVSVLSADGTATGTLCVTEVR